MAFDTYAQFMEGQTLTATELNTVMSHAIHRDRLVGRMAGFGINCGLTGSFSGNTLTIQPGLAVDQRGESMVATSAHDINFGPTTTATLFDFINPGAGGFSVVLRSAYTHTDPTPCSESTACAGHSATQTLELSYEVVPGQIKGSRFAFASESLLSAEPIRLSIDSQPLNDFNALRTTLVTRLNNSGAPLVNPALISKLASVTMPAGDLPGVKGYKAGWLNMVLFATLDLLRCRALMGIDCLKDTETPGVVLGWAERVGPDWFFRCTYRHEWEPPKGLTRAFLGGTCDNPCRVFLDALEGILAGYAPPDPPPAPTPPATGGGGVVIPGIFVEYCAKGFILQNGKCMLFAHPWEKVPIKYPPPKYKIPDPEIYYKDQGDWLVNLVFENYGQEAWNYFGDGVLDAGGMLGQHVENVEVTLGAAVKEHGGTPSFVRVAEGELGTVGGAIPTLGFSPSDGVALVMNAKGIVTGMGRIPALHSAKQVGTAIPAALAASVKVDGAVEQMSGLAHSVDVAVGDFAQQLDGLDGTFKGLQQQFQSFKGGQFDQSGFGARLNNLESRAQKIDLYGERISSLEGRTLMGKSVAAMEAASGISADVGKVLAEFTQSTIEAIRTIKTADNKNLGRYVGAAERSQGEFEIAVAGGDQVAIHGALVEILGSVRTMVKASGIDASAGRKLDAQYRDVQGILG